jgi:stress response protein YsnF
VGGERQSLIDVELKRTEFRLDVLKLRKQLTEIGVRRGAESEQPVAVVTTPAGTVVERAGQTPAAASVAEKTAPAPPASG